MLDSTNVKPKFGQVWQYGDMFDMPFLLIARLSAHEWKVIYLGSLSPIVNILAGLWDDGGRRIHGYKLLEDVE